jgi:hypothetical protein
MAHQKKRRKSSRKHVPSQVRKPFWRRAGWPMLLLLLVAAVATVWALTGSKAKKPSGKLRAKSDIPSLVEILAMNLNELANVDIALMNLRCAEGLKGSEGLDVSAALKTLDQFAAHVKEQTEQNFYRFTKNPSDFENSEPYYRLMMMAIVLQEDGKIQYNPARISLPGNPEANEKFFANCKDVFINGLTGPPLMGTCSSLPVLYVAIGRRLGYPLRLVSTKCHLFVRWEDDKTRLNVEATGSGFKTYDDNFYKTWPYTVTEKEVAENGYLKAMTPNEELACFMSFRGACFYEGMGYYTPGIEAYREAYRLAPHNPAHRVLLKMSVEMLQARQAHQLEWLLEKADNPKAPPPPTGLFRRPANR